MPIKEWVWGCFKNSLSLIKDGKADFIWDHHSSYWGHYSEIFCVREIQLKSKYSMSAWGFIANEQGVGQWLENY